MQIAGPILGVVVGFLLSEGKSWLMRRRKLKSHWAALKSEAQACSQKAQVYLKDQIMAPLYRLPRQAFERCLPELMIEGVISSAALDALAAFFGQVDDLNRGLDLAQSRYEKSGEDNDALLKQIYGRNRMYAAKLIPGSPDELFTGSMHVIESHL